MRNRSVLGVVLFALLGAAGCEETKLPMAPSELVTGIVIYEHANYLGASGLVDKNISNLKDYKGPCTESDTDANGNSSTTFIWANCISSIRVSAGWKATLYKDRDFKGKILEISADVSNLQLMPGDCDHGGFNDCIESVKVMKQ